MNRAANPMSSQFRHDAETLPPNLTVNLTSDVTSAETDSCDFHCLPECSFSTPYQGVSGSRNLTHSNAYSSISKKSIFHGHKIQLDQIPIAQRSVAWNAMDRFVIYADARRARESINLSWTGLCPMFYEHTKANLVEFRCTDPTSNSGSHLVQRPSNDLANNLELFEFLSRLYRHRSRRITVPF
jgi:hypothetical protein